MSDVTVTVDVDDKSLQRTLNELERKVQEGATEGLEDTLEQGEEAAISKLEQERRAYNSPHLRNSFTTNITGPDDSQTGTIHNPREYAAYVDQGVSGTQRKRDTPFSYDSSKPPLDKMIEYVEQRMSSWNLDDDTPFGEGNFPLRLGGRGRIDDGGGDDDGGSPPGFYQPLDNYELDSGFDKKRISDTDELAQDVDIYVDDGENLNTFTVENIDYDGTLEISRITENYEFNINDAEYDIVGRQSNPSIHELDTRAEDGEGTEVIVKPEVGTYRDSTFYGEIEEELTREEVRVYRIDSYGSNYNGEAIELDVVDDDLVGTRENNPEEWFEEVPDDEFANSLESVPDSHTRYDVTEENLELARKNDEQILIEWKGNEYLADVGLNNNSTLYEIDAGTTANGEEIKFVYETDTQTSYVYDGGTELDFVSLTGITNEQETWFNLSEGDDILVDISENSTSYELTEEFDFDADQAYANINGVSENQQAYLRGSYEENFRDNAFVSAFRRNKNTELTYGDFIGTREDNPDKWGVKDLSIGDRVTGYTDTIGGQKKVTGRIKRERREYTSHGGEVRVIDENGNGHTINDFDVTNIEKIDRVEEPPREPTLPEAYDPYEYDVLDDINLDERFYAWLEGEQRFAKVEKGDGFKLVDEDNSPSYYRQENNPYTLTLVGRKGYYKNIEEYDSVTSYKNTRVDDADTLQGVSSVYFDTGEETIEAEIEDINSARDIITVSHTKEVNGNTETEINLDAYENQIFRISESNLEPSDIERDYYKELDRYGSKSARGKLYEGRASANGGDVEYRPQRIESTDDVFEGLRIAVDYGDETKYGKVTEIDKEKHTIKIDAGLGGTFIKLADPSEDGQIIGRKDEIYKQELTEGEEIAIYSTTDDIFPEKFYGTYQQAPDGTHQIKTSNGEVREIQTIRYRKQNEPEQWNDETDETDYYKSLDEYEVSEDFRKERINSTDDVFEGLEIKYDNGATTSDAVVTNVDDGVNSIDVRYEGVRNTRISFDDETENKQIYARQQEKLFVELDSSDEIKFKVDGKIGYGAVTDNPTGSPDTIDVDNYNLDGIFVNIEKEDYLSTRNNLPEDEEWFDEVDDEIRAQKAETDGEPNQYDGFSDRLTDGATTKQKRAIETNGGTVIVEANSTDYIASIEEKGVREYTTDVGITPDGENLDGAKIAHIPSKLVEFNNLQEGDDVLLDISDISNTKLEEEFNFEGQSYYTNFVNNNQAYVRAKKSNRGFRISGTQKEIANRYSSYIETRDDNPAAWNVKNAEKGDIVKTEESEGRVVSISREKQYHGGQIEIRDFESGRRKFVNDFDVTEFTKDPEFKDKPDKAPETTLPEEYIPYSDTPDVSYEEGDTYYAFLEGKEEFAEVEYSGYSWQTTAEDRNNKIQYRRNRSRVSTYSLQLVGEKAPDGYTFAEDPNDGDSLTIRGGITIDDDPTTNAYKTPPPPSKRNFQNEEIVTEPPDRDFPVTGLQEGDRFLAWSHRRGKFQEVYKAEDGDEFKQDRYLNPYRIDRPTMTGSYKPDENDKADLPIQIIGKLPDKEVGFEGGSAIGKDGENLLWFGQTIQYEQVSDGETVTYDAEVRDWDETTIYLEGGEHDSISRYKQVDSQFIPTGGQSWQNLSEDEKEEQIIDEFKYRVPKSFENDNRAEEIEELVTEQYIPAFANKEDAHDVMSNMHGFSDETNNDNSSGEHVRRVGNTYGSFNLNLKTKQGEGINDGQVSTFFHESTHALNGVKIQNGDATYSKDIVADNFPTGYVTVPLKDNGQINYRDANEFGAKHGYTPSTSFLDAALKDSSGDIIGDANMDIDATTRIEDSTDVDVTQISYDSTTEMSDFFDPLPTTDIEAGDAIKIYRGDADEEAYLTFTGTTIEPEKDVDSTGVGLRFRTSSGNPARVTIDSDGNLAKSDLEFRGYAATSIPKTNFTPSQFEPSSDDPVERFAESVNRVSKEQYKLFQRDYEENDAATALSHDAAIRRPYSSSTPTELSAAITEMIRAKDKASAMRMVETYDKHPHLIESALDVFNPSDEAKEVIENQIPELEL